MEQIQRNPEDLSILIGEAPFSSGDNGPSVVYLKKLIIAIDRSTDKASLDRNIDLVVPDGKVLHINIMLKGMYSNTREGNHTVKQQNLIKFLLDLKRCGDYEQVDAIRLIQDQNEGTNNRFGLQDILFTTGDRLCSLYSRYKKTNVQFFVAGTQRYYLYRQPYIYPSDEIRNTIAQQNIFNELKQKAKKAEEFMTNIQVLNDFDVDDVDQFQNNIMDPAVASSYIKSLFTYIYLLQKDRLTQLKHIVNTVDLKSKIQFCQDLQELSFDKIQNDPAVPFYFEQGSTILNIKYKENQTVVNCNKVIDSFYFLASSEIFSEMASDEGQFLDMDIIKGKIVLEKNIPQKTTISLLDFISDKDEEGKLIPAEDIKREITRIL